MELDIYASIVNIDIAKEKKKDHVPEENYDKYKASIYQTISEKTSIGEEIIKISLPIALGEENLNQIFQEFKQKYRSHFRELDKNEKEILWVIDLHYTEDELADARLILALKEENRKQQLYIRSLEEKLKRFEIALEMVKEDNNKLRGTLIPDLNRVKNANTNIDKDTSKIYLNSENIGPIFQKFLSERIHRTEKETDKIQAAKILEAFNDWTEENKYSFISDKLLAAQLRKNNIKKHKGHFTYYLCIKFK